MNPAGTSNFTQLLIRHREGETSVRDQIVTAIYGELRRLAARYLAGERSQHTLQPTALVNEAWMRFADNGAAAQNRSHFIALAAGVMKEVLIDHARKKLAAKRGGGELLFDLEGAPEASTEGPEQVLELCDLLEKLRELDPRQARLVELKVFGGLGFEEVATELGVSLATVKRDWLLVRAWLVRELQ